MYILYYFEQDYDTVDKTLIASSYDFDKLLAKKQQMIDEYQKQLAEYNQQSELFQKSWQEFRLIAMEFWNRHRDSIKNPNRTDGLWLQDIVIKPAKYKFRISGYCGIPEEDFQDVVETCHLTNDIIEKIKDKQIEYLPSYHDKLENVVDLSVLDEAIPMFDYAHPLYDIGSRYDENNLFIEDVQEI